MAAGPHTLQPHVQYLLYSIRRTCEPLLPSATFLLPPFPVSLWLEGSHVMVFWLDAPDRTGPPTDTDRTGCMLLVPVL